MAYKNLLQPVRMESQFVDTKLFTVFYQTGTTPANAEVLDGTIVVLGDFVADPVYTARYTAHTATLAPTELNTRQAVIAVSTDSDVCVIDLATVATKTGGTGTIRDGYTTIGLAADAGVPVRARELVKNDVFVTAEDNVTSALTVGQYATVSVGQWAPSSTAITGGATCCQVVDKYVISQGITNGVTAYRLLVKTN